MQRKGAVAAHERNMSAIIQWSDKLSLGIPEIDGQHKGLIDVTRFERTDLFLPV